MRRYSDITHQQQQQQQNAIHSQQQQQPPQPKQPSQTQQQQQPRQMGLQPPFAPSKLVMGIARSSPYKQPPHRPPTALQAPESSASCPTKARTSINDTIIWALFSTHTNSKNRLMLLVLYNKIADGMLSVPKLFIDEKCMFHCPRKVNNWSRISDFYPWASPSGDTL